MNFAPLHNHSEYSALDGLSTFREIAERCVAIGCPCCGVTDHGTVAGHLEAAQVFAKYDIKPVLGCELYHGVKTEFGKNERDQAHFIAGALTDEGLRNLWRLVDAASQNFRYVGRVTFDLLEKHSEGLFATSACIQGLVAQDLRSDEPDYKWLNQYLDIFGDNFYIELHTYPGEEHEELNRRLVEAARMKGVGLVYATDAHFASPEQYQIHDAYVAMQTGEDILMDVEDRKMWHPMSLYIQSEEEIRASLAYLPEDAVDEALTNTGLIADSANAGLPKVTRHLPDFNPKSCPWTEPALGYEPGNAAVMILDLVERGITEKYGDDEAAWDRARFELEVLLESGLEHYFLQAWDFCEFCNRNNIQRGPGRGSSAGSIVAYALGITDIDPIHYDLFFERFWNPGRAKGFPDIDNDFPQAERKRVRQYLMKRWGVSKVRTIGTIMRLKPKAVIDRTYNACGMTFQEKEDLKKIISNVPDIDILGPDSIGWTEELDPGKTIYVMNHVGPKIIKWVESLPEERQDLALTWLNVLEVVCSRVSGYGVHPSGVVVADCDLDAELPSMWNSKQKVQVTCFPMSDVDDRMFVKQDLLGLRNLDTLMDWQEQVKQKGIEVEWSGLERRADIPEEMWKLLDDGFTLGIFQIERGYARQLCKEFKPRSVEDLGIIISLNRPGPIRSGAPDSFLKRRNGVEPVTYDHPILEDILEPTYGWFLYQEQVISFFNKLGYDLSESDAVRKILGKKKPEDMLALRNGDGEWEGRGYFTMAEVAGVPSSIAQIIWDKLEDFAKYSFNKSHAIAYATIAFRTLYAKYTGLAEFVMACIRTNEDDAGLYVGEGRRMGIDVLPPEIIESQPEVAVKDSNIYFGLSNVKGVGKGSARYICDLRLSYELYSPEALADALEEEDNYWQQRRDEAKLLGVSFKERSPKQVLRSNQIVALYQAGAWDNYEDRELSLTAQQKLEKELLGVILTDDCAAVFSRNMDLITDTCSEYHELEGALHSEVLAVPGAVSQIDPKKTKKDGKAMGIVSVEFEGDEVEFVVFPQQWAAYKFLWKERTPGIFKIKSSERGWSFDSGVKLQ